MVSAAAATARGHGACGRGPPAHSTSVTHGAPLPPPSPPAHHCEPPTYTTHSARTPHNMIPGLIQRVPGLNQEAACGSNTQRISKQTHNRIAPPKHARFTDAVSPKSLTAPSIRCLQILLQHSRQRAPTRKATTGTAAQQQPLRYHDRKWRAARLQILTGMPL